MVLFWSLHFPMELLRTGSTLRFGCVQGKQLAEDTKFTQRDQSLWLSQPSLRIPTFLGTMGAESGVICAPLSAPFAPTLNGSLLLNPYPSVSGTRLFRAPIYFRYLSLIFPSVSKGSSNLPIIVASFSPHHACEFASFWNSGPLSHFS
jgi:hypothetical protein